MKHVVCALLVLCAFATTALARQVNVGTVPIDLPPLPGYCELDETQPGDARMLAAINSMLEPSGNRLLAVSADCRQLDDWRNGRRRLLGSMAQYQTLRAWEHGSLPASPEQVIRSACAQFRAQGESIVSSMTPGIQARAEEVMKTVKVNEMKFLGVLGEDANACYASLLQRFRAETGDDVTQAAVFAATTIRSKIIYSYLFAPFEGGHTLDDLHARLRASVAALEAANRN